MSVLIRAEEAMHGERDPHQRLALAIVCLAALIINVDNTILNVALPTLVRDLHATSSQLQWIVDSYAMVFAGLLLVGGTLADRFGRKRFFLIGLSVFALGSIGAALSSTVTTLIAFRALMGVGAALTIPTSLAIINDIFRDPSQRARAIGVWGGTIGLGIAIGPIAGGLLLSRFWWGSIFLVNVPIACIGFLGAALGTLGGYIAMIGWLRSNSLNGGIAALGNIPVADLLFILVGMPVFAALVGWLFAGREPATMTHQAIE